MKKLKIRVGIAGLGVVGLKRKKFIEENKLFKLVALCDKKIKPQLSASQAFFNDPFEMISTQELDAIFVCLTNDIAPRVVEFALNQGLHVFCEKPPGRNIEDIKSIIGIEKNSPKLKLMYGFNHRFHKSIVKAKEIIDSKKLGSIINMNGMYGKSQIITFNQDDWRTKREISGGGVLLDQGIHMVDLMRFFSGEFEEIYSFVNNDFWGFEVEDNAYALMKTQDGIVAMLHSSATAWKHNFSLSINLEKGALLLSGILSGSKSYGEELLTIIEADVLNDQGNPNEVTYKYNEDPSWKLEVDEFCNSIIEDKQILHGSSSEALKTMETVFKIYYNDELWRNKYKIEI